MGDEEEDEEEDVEGLGEADMEARFRRRRQVNSIGSLTFSSDLLLFFCVLLKYRRCPIQ